MKVLKHIFICGLCLFTASCGNDWLNMEPSTSIKNEDGYQQIGDIEYALNGIYNIMQNAYAYSGRLVYYGDVTGDDMQAVSSTKRTGSYYLFAYTKDNAPSTHWSYLYSIIGQCNYILADVDRLVDAEKNKESFDENKPVWDDWKGQALALRGMALFDLTRIFGYPYKKDNGASLGVPIIKQVLAIQDKPARGTVAECYAQIIADLEDGTTLLAGDFNKGKINKWAALTLLSRVYLYKGDDAKALEKAEAAIGGAENEKYALWTNAEYPTAWSNDASSSKPGEVLFEIVNTNTDGAGNESMGYLSSSDGYDDLCITSSFYALLLQDPNDVRLKLLSFDGTKYAYVFKYQPQDGENIEDANIPLIRLSEAYLNAAEAAQKLVDNDKAVKFLDPIVKRANPAKTVTGQQITHERILTERRKELVCEGHRMYDALRDGGKATRSDVANNKIKSTKHLSGTYEKEYDWDWYKVVLPIPKAEIDTNPNIKQNPDY
ncbi:MAG: RagB/SusD family nutrient uptake outer membrane protein [Mediterranea sp.]|jgi:hypothetical protein|nr:RagB/SusD family nutrient uptake outer membrane protein [Mediterranea sp.]